MKLSNSQLINSIPVLNQLSGQSLPVRASFYISKNMRNIKIAATTFEEEKKKLMNKYCEKKEDGSLNVQENGSVNIVDQENWKKDFPELLSLESDIEITKIHVSDFNQVTLTPQEVPFIEFMLEE